MFGRRTKEVMRDFSTDISANIRRPHLKQTHVFTGNKGFSAGSWMIALKKHTRATQMIVEMSAKMEMHLIGTQHTVGITHYSHHSIFPNFNQLSTACVRPEEGVLRRKRIVVNWSRVDKGAVGIY